VCVCENTSKRYVCVCVSERIHPCDMCVCVREFMCVCERENISMQDVYVCVRERIHPCLRVCVCVCLSMQASHKTDFLGSTSESAFPWQHILPLARPKGNIYKSSAQQILNLTCEVEAIRMDPHARNVQTHLRVHQRDPGTTSLTHLYVSHTHQTHTHTHTHTIRTY